MSRDVKTLRMSIYFLVLSIINKTWMHYQKLYSTFYRLNRTNSYLWGGWTTNDTNWYLVLYIFKSYLWGGWMTKDTNGYLVSKRFTKSNLWGGWTTKDTNGYLVLEKFTKSYLRNGRTIKDTNEYLILKKFSEIYPRCGQTTKDTNEYLALYTYRVDEWPRTPTGTWSCTFLVSPIYSVDGYLILENFTKSYLWGDEER